jgi:hypothetical protein
MLELPGRLPRHLTNLSSSKRASSAPQPPNHDVTTVCRWLQATQSPSPFFPVGSATSDSSLCWRLDTEVPLHGWAARGLYRRPLLASAISIGALLGGASACCVLAVLWLACCSYSCLLWWANSQSCIRMWLWGVIPPPPQSRGLLETSTVPTGIRPYARCD